MAQETNALDIASQTSLWLSTAKLFIAVMTLFSPISRSNTLALDTKKDTDGLAPELPRLDSPDFRPQGSSKGSMDP